MSEAITKVAGAVKERVGTLYEEMLDKGIGGLVIGGTKVALDIVDDYLVYQSNLGQLRGFDKPLIEIGVGVIGTLADPERVGKYTSPLLAVGVADALYQLYKFIRKEPYGYVKDKNTIQVFSLEGGKNVEVWVDGSAVNINTVTDSNGNATITLPTELSAGDHYIVVKAGAKAITIYVKI